jgi:hypothetical protein
LGVLDTPDMCFKLWSSQFYTCLTFQNHHTTPYFYLTGTRRFYLFSLAEYRSPYLLRPPQTNPSPSAVGVCRSVD